MSKETIIYYFHGRDVGITRKFISFHVMVGFTRRFIMGIWYATLLVYD